MLRREAESMSLQVTRPCSYFFSSTNSSVLYFHRAVCVYAVNEPPLGQRMNEISRPNGDTTRPEISAECAAGSISPDVLFGVRGSSKRTLVCVCPRAVRTYIRRFRSVKSALAAAFCSLEIWWDLRNDILFGKCGGGDAHAFP
jgi:hypothetical protein